MGNGQKRELLVLFRPKTGVPENNSGRECCWPYLIGQLPLLWAGTLLRICRGRLPKRIIFGNLEIAVRRGRGGKEKERTDCVQSDIRAFGITGDWKTMALKAEVWVEAVTEGGRRFMAAWREEKQDAARHRQEKREATRLGKLQSHTEA